MKWFDPEKGFGFITPHVSAPDVFVHWSGIRGSTSHARRSLSDGARVEYVVVTDKGGRPKADDVEVRA